MIEFICTSLKLQSIIKAHTSNSFSTTSIWWISDWSLLLISSLYSPTHESAAFYNFRAVHIEGTTLNSSSVAMLAVTGILCLATCYLVTAHSLLYVIFEPLLNNGRLTLAPLFPLSAITSHYECGQTAKLLVGYFSIGPYIWSARFKYKNCPVLRMVNLKNTNLV
jgi:hypothetical protein